ncbi:hypothetical protein CspeluHIS016_0703360 [Cutaneotrichosporon spelunceum]|uniref:Protein phosphatase PP2A regulatory subunit B n=1 Tax=Cutaneotrichosporon spelunceum TaxID=1672016 RepID=A0AAD3TYQ0_9TREE|nr:hypothetical protein CspeluHIS016_0703360 [Cutaneotrichosporon spelunceum]
MDQEAPTNQWRFAQCFGDKGEVEDITEADIISTVEFDHTGDYLATGDKGGRVVLFERNEQKKGCEYKFYTEFQSHEPEFDYLKSLEIEEKINRIRWCKRQNAAHFLLSTNDKTIKLWKVFDKQIKVVAENNHSQDITGGGPVGAVQPQLRLPRMTTHDSITAAVPRKVYANAHAYHINSISVNSDGETYISADDLRINLWNLNISDQSFNIVDIKPVNMEELTEVITAAEFHPIHCNLFMYSSSKGTIKLADMRESALCDQHAKLFEEEEDPSQKSFFSEIISSISDVKFSRDGRYILSRDYLTLKIWDMNMENKPVKTINIHDHLRQKLCDLYENDCIFDKFECTFSGDGSQVMTGSYHNYFRIYDVNSDNDVVLQADKSAFKAKKIGGARGKVPGKKEGMQTEGIDFAKKILHGSWHPRENTIAIAATNNLYGNPSPLVTDHQPPSHFDKQSRTLLSRVSSPAWSSTSTTPSDHVPSLRPFPSTRSTSELDGPLLSSTIKAHPRTVSAPLPNSTLSNSERFEEPPSSTYKSRDDSSAERTRNTFVTPGLTQRTLGAVSSARRTNKPISNLSRFGGPARRIARPEPEGAETIAVEYPSRTGPPPTAPHQELRVSASTPASAPQTKRVFLVNGEGYDRLGILGRGGSSKVYSVLGHTKRVVYALKRVGLERADAETYQSYTNEIELLRRLRDDVRVIQLIDHQITFNSSGRPKLLMMVMECGEIDFAALLDEQRDKPLNMNFVGLYWQQMLEAVQAVHAENVVHTDLKPANFVLVKGRLKIIDFGIAKAIANDTVNIQRDQQIGTVNYMSPEAIQRMNNQKVLKLSYPSDVWSLGCILYQMVYGNPPFHAIPGGPLSKMNKIADPTHRIDYPPTTSFSPPGGPATPTAVTVPSEAIATMRGCLDYHKDRRFTIPELLDHEFLSPSGPRNTPPGSTWITKEQMAIMIGFVQRSRDQRLTPQEVADDLFDQLAAQNSLAKSS